MVRIATRAEIGAVAASLKGVEASENGWYEHGWNARRPAPQRVPQDQPRVRVRSTPCRSIGCREGCSGPAMSSVHVLVISMPPGEPGEAIFPEWPDDRDYDVACTDRQRCKGWLECLEPHDVDGRAAGSPYIGDVADPWWGADEFEFHGVTHTWREGYGWTVPHPGCPAEENGAEPPYGAHLLPIGRYEVDDQWDDTSCYLKFTTKPPTRVDDETEIVR